MHFHKVYALNGLEVLFLWSAGCDTTTNASPIGSGVAQAQGLPGELHEIMLSVICAVKHILNGLHMLVHSVSEFHLFTNHYMR